VKIPIDEMLKALRKQELTGQQHRAAQVRRVQQPFANFKLAGVRTMRWSMGTQQQ